jgi:hypothetical protein
MKVISIIQPWATLIALGEKKFETRSWATKHRGELAIHASKKIDKDACRNMWFESVLEKHGFNEKNLPTGVILATSILAECYKVTNNYEDSALLEAYFCADVTISGNEFEFGDYSEGRYAWELVDVKVLQKPIPAKGQLGLWNYPL